MKTLSTVFLGVLAAASLAVAQTAVTETTTTAAPLEAAGTVTTFDPSGSLVISSQTGAPVTYGYSKTTTFVDELGNPVSVNVVKSGLPVTVYYSGDQRLVSKVVVRRAVAAPVTTTVDEPVTIKKTTTTTTTTKKDDD